MALWTGHLGISGINISILLDWYYKLVLLVRADVRVVNLQNSKKSLPSNQVHLLS